MQQIGTNAETCHDNVQRVRSFGTASPTWDVFITVPLPCHQGSGRYAEEKAEKAEDPERMDGSKKLSSRHNRTGAWMNSQGCGSGKCLHRSKSDGVQALRGRLDTSSVPLQLTSVCKGKLVICNGALLGY